MWCRTEQVITFIAGTFDQPHSDEHNMGKTVKNFCLEQMVGPRSLIVV
jgi:hypothetical protein